MRLLKNFDEFLGSGIVRKRFPDKARADSLINDAEKRMNFLKEIIEKVGLRKDNANYFIENSYDVLIGLLRARMLMLGYYAAGEGAHEAEVSFMRNLGFSEKEVRFMNDLRYFRNGILYYGKEFDVEYAWKVLDFLNKIYPKLRKT